MVLDDELLGELLLPEDDELGEVVLELPLLLPEPEELPLIPEDEEPPAAEPCLAK